MATLVDAKRHPQLRQFPIHLPTPPGAPVRSPALRLAIGTRILITAGATSPLPVTAVPRTTKLAMRSTRRVSADMK